VCLTLWDEQDEARFMQEYRQRRIAEMQARAKAARFGAVLDISADSFRQDVRAVPKSFHALAIVRTLPRRRAHAEAALPPARARAWLRR